MSGTARLRFGGIAEHRRRRLQRRDRQRQHAAERRRVDRDRRRGQAAAGEDLGEQAAERVADRPPASSSSLPMTSSKWSATWPTVLCAKTSGWAFASSTVSGSSGQPGRQRRVAGLLEDRRPAVPAARQQPEAVDEDDRRAPRRVRRLDLLRLVLGDRRHALVALSWMPVVADPAIARIPGVRDDRARPRAGPADSLARCPPAASPSRRSRPSATDSRRSAARPRVPAGLPRRGGGRGGGRGAPAHAGERVDLPFVTIDPPGLARPRPGAAPRAPRRRAPRALRDRRRRRVRRARAARSTARPTPAG